MISSAGSLHQRGASGVLARILTAGIVSFAVTGIASVAPETATASGMGAWYGQANSSRVQFRPWQPRQPQRQADARWRPHHRAGSASTPTPRYQAAPRQPALIATERRYSAPVSRAFARSVNVGVRFRPNSRVASSPADRVQTTPQPVPPDRHLQSQFRPSPPSRRMTYEQMQAQRPALRSWSPYTNVAGYGVSTATDGSSSVAGYPAYWRTW